MVDSAHRKVYALAWIEEGLAMVAMCDETGSIRETAGGTHNSRDAWSEVTPTLRGRGSVRLGKLPRA